MANLKGATSRQPTPEEIELEKEIGLLIKKARVMAGMSQKELGEKTAWSHQSISKFENGEGHVPIASLIVMSRVLGVGIFQLIPDDAKNRADRVFEMLLLLPPEKQALLLHAFEPMIQSQR